MLNVSNSEFIACIFGEDAHWCHVTDFIHDPGDIPKEKVLTAWKGDYFSRYQFTENSNQYFTISTFYADNQQQARRRKALYRQTHCVVLDDVREKLSEEAAQRLPQPSWILETSKGSFQWGYILSQPCTVASHIDNLNDGLIASDLAPSGKDPGQRGVTRYVRLPEGYNNKASKLINGQPFKCVMHSWLPFNTVTLEQLAEPFGVDMYKPRRESRTDGAADIPDHPLINIPDVIHIKEERSNGRFDITCPWVSEHTGDDDSGSAVFTNADGSLGFKCHHGACDGRTGVDLLRYISGEDDQFRHRLKNWQVLRAMPAPSPPPNMSFMEAVEVYTVEVDTVEPIEEYISGLRKIRPNTDTQRNTALEALKLVDDMPKIDQVHWHNEIADIMRWSKATLREILKEQRAIWYEQKTVDFYDDVVYIKEQNQFYSFSKHMFFTPEAFNNAFMSEDGDARKNALMGRVANVDKLDYAPKEKRIFSDKNLIYANAWSAESQGQGTPGDISRWKDHFKALGWEMHEDHMVQWMAYTLQHPEKKINHMLLLGSGEGCGKDFLLYPLIMGMGDNCTVIAGDELLESFNDYVMRTKYLHINETELGDHRDAYVVANRLKPLAAAPPEKLSVNQKGVKRIHVRNILNATMTTNSATPLRLNGASRRFYAVWSDLNPRDKHGDMLASWVEYWNDRWEWMRSGGWEHVLYYLINEVDTSKFNPGQSPKVTDFLRDIREYSETPLQTSIRTFEENKYGAFRSDILTRADIVHTLRNSVVSPTELSCDPYTITERKVSTALREMGCYKTVRTAQSTLWIVRNPEKYQDMRPYEIEDERRAQLETKTELKVVK